MLDVGGMPLVAHVKKQLDDHFQEVIIGANDPCKFGFLGCRIVSDQQKDRGPLMGIYSCLQASATEVNFITACDIPDMNMSVIRHMLMLSQDADIVVPRSGNCLYEPLFAVYRKSAIPGIESLFRRDQYSVVKLFDEVRIKTVCFARERWFFNLNSMADYHIYIQKIQQP